MTDHEIFYRALLTRDRRFDGRFFTGVRTTGIYCRPVCPARTPKRGNITFFPSAWAAEAAGLRPCLRCRPEAAPGSAEWLGSEAKVGRALRLIEEGALEETGLAGLALRVGVGERQLRRLFQQHLGVSPVVVAQTQRVQLSKQLLDQTDLPLAQVAFAAGFASVRRFNAVFFDTYGRPPSAIRRKSSPSVGSVSLALAYRPPFSWDKMADYLRPRLFAGCEFLENTGYHRLQRTSDGFAKITISPGRDALLLNVPVSMLGSLVKFRARARRMFDLDADPVGIADQLQDLAPPPELLRVPGAWDPFESAVRIVLGQQVSVKGAATLAGRLVKQYGEPVGDGPLSHLFPLPAALAEAPLEQIGLPRSRAESLRRLAQAVTEQPAMLENETLSARLLAIPGIGPWTVAMVALRLGDPDVFPAGDLVLRQRTGDRSAPELDRWAQRWRPFRSYAAMALWQTSTESP
jgi:AraC family transcriptional regulator of adaptative response / DNA-3-methyladenine glycosylase II